MRGLVQHSMVGAVCLVALAGFVSAQAKAKAPAAGDPVKGKTVFNKNCVICHNADGSGGKKITPNGNPSRNFRDPKFWAERTDAQLRSTINNGVAKSGMVAWKGILKPKEIEDVLAYIHTFNPAHAAKKEAGAAVK